MIERVVISDPSWSTLLKAVQTFPLPSQPHDIDGEIVLYRYGIQPPGSLKELPSFIQQLQEYRLRPRGLRYHFTRIGGGRPFVEPNGSMETVPPRFYGIYSHDEKSTPMDDSSRSRLGSFSFMHERDHVATVNLDHYTRSFTSDDVLHFLNVLLEKDFKIGQIKLGSNYRIGHSTDRSGGELIYYHGAPRHQNLLRVEGYGKLDDGEKVKYNDWLKSL